MAALTIFTPSYNNGEHIRNLYQRLLKQTCKDFEWFIVDDGSSDDTGDIVSGFQRNADFKIRYSYQENQGKYRACHHGVRECGTELFCCVDADFLLYENTVEILLSEWSRFQEKEPVIGIGMPLICRHYDDLSRITGGSFPARTPETGRLSELTSRYGYHGETLYMFTANALKELTIPDVPGEKFWTESAFYFPLNKDKVHWLNLPAGESVYQAGGLSDHRLKHEINSPRLTLLFYKRGAVYHPLLLHRIAGCCLYISWKRLLKLKDESAGCIPLHIRIPAFFIEPVYCRRFRREVRKGLSEDTK